MCGVSHAPPTGHLARNPGMCPDWESNQQPFGSQASTQSTEPHQPGLISLFLISPEDMFTDFGERTGEGERETSMGERNIDQLPPLRAPTGGGTHNLLLNG